MDKTKPTREQIKAALVVSDDIQKGGIIMMPIAKDSSIVTLAAAYRATQRPAQIIGRIIGYIIAAALGVLALAGLLAAVKVLMGVVG